MRTRRPCSTESYSHASPAAHTPSAEVASEDEHATPPVSPSSRPAERASITSGTAPVPITTRSASTAHYTVHDRIPMVTVWRFETDRYHPLHPPPPNGD